MAVLNDPNYVHDDMDAREFMLDVFNFQKGFVAENQATIFELVRLGLQGKLDKTLPS